MYEGQSIVLDNMFEPKERDISVKYLLRNNTLAKVRQNLSSVDEIVVEYILAKAQKQLLKLFNEENKEYNTSDFPASIVTSISNKEMAELTNNKAYIGASGLKRFCDVAGGIRISYVSYIDGAYRNTALIKTFTWYKETPDRIFATIDKDAYLYLIDYSLRLREDKIKINEYMDNDGMYKKIEDNREVRKSRPIKNKEPHSGGYRKEDIEILLLIKSPYARAIFFDLKKVYETKHMSKYKIKSVENTYDLEEIKERFTLENKYTVFYDFKKKVLNVIVEQINNSGYMTIDYTLVSKNVLGGKKTTGVTFKAIIHDKLIEQRFGKDKEGNETNDSCGNSIEELLSNRLKVEGGLRLGSKTIRNLIEKYGEEIVIDKINRMLYANKTDKVKAPKRYLERSLENAEKNLDETSKNDFVDVEFEDISKTKGNYTSNNSKRIGKNQSNIRSDKEYKKMEDELTSWYMD